MTEFQYKKHVKIVCDLNIGDSVMFDNWGYQLNGKVCIIEDIKLKLGTESGVVVKVDKYNSYVDSNWIIKI